jgi:rare lipoprotein A
MGTIINKYCPDRLYLLGIIGLLGLWLWGCSQAKPPSTPPGHPKPYRVGKTWYQPVADARDFRQRGVASWYGRKFHGRRTSNGETYDMYAMTAAHKTLPFGTHVRVHNLSNDREAVVRINDRGPFVRGRIIDLSYTAAKKIGMVGPGTAKVEIVALGAVTSTRKAGSKEPTYTPIDYYSGNFTIQIGAFKDRRNAANLRRKLGQTYKNAHITEFYDGHETWYRVRVGKTRTLNQAIEYEALLIQNGYPDAFIIAE